LLDEGLQSAELLDSAHLLLGAEGTVAEQPGEPAAAQWLRQVRRATGGTADVTAAGYADPDSPAEVSAGLLSDLKARGLLEETLVIWGGEFGRTPMSEQGDGRDHNPTGFTMWMAGGGVQGGRTYGATDDLGLYAVEDRLHVHDLHATILHLLGIDHTALTYTHKGRPERVDQNEGSAYTKLLGA
jgi:hypothetical protein